MSYQLANNQPRSRDTDETGAKKPPLPQAGNEPDEDRSNVIPLPVIAPRENEHQAWLPPKEVIWMGHPLSVLALSIAIAARGADAATGSDSKH
jgi:hypothetical protein